MRGIRSKLWRPGVVLATGVTLLGFASVANAATFTVNDTRDLAQSGSASSGACVSTASTCTLRTAIQAANQNGGSNTINLPAGTYPIDSASGGTNDLSTGEFKINPANNSTAVTVIGAGSGSTVINAQGNDRIFTVFQNGALDLQKMTLENGAPGGAHHSASYDLGGAIYSQGHLSAEAVTFTGNTAVTSGGAIVADNFSASTLSLTGDVFQNNTAEYGGAIFTDAPNDATIAFTLFQANSATGSGDGGAIDSDSDAAALTLTFDEFLQNVAGGEAAGLYWDGSGALSVSQSLFKQNQAQADGGGIFNEGNVNVTVSNTSFDGNASTSGSGIYDDAQGTAMTLTQDRFSANSVTGSGLTGLGGALRLWSAATITGSEFDGNQSTEEGGAVFWSAGALTILSSSFVLNSAVDGGALYMDAARMITMENSTLSRNTASDAGGAIHADAEGATLINDTIAFNNAPAAEGGGVYDPTDLTSTGSATGGFGVENTVIAQNSGGDCSNGGGTPTFNAAQDLGNNDDSDQTCFGGLAGPNDKAGVNPLLSNPANNGGPAAGGPGDTVTVQTDAEQASSPTVNAGNNNGCPAVDERGVSRPQGSACDIGAFEFGANPLTTTTSSGGTTTSTSRTTATSTTTTRTTGHKHKRRCRKGKVRRHGRCVRKHHRRHKKR